MLLTLALLAQTLTPDPEGVKAARTCAVAVTAASGSSEPGMAEVAALIYYVSQSVKAEGSTTPFLTRINEVTGELRGEAAQTQAQAQANLAECGRRYPLARKTGPVKLPAKPFDRDLMCFAALGVMMGASQGKADDTGDSSDVTRYQPAFGVYSGRLNGDALGKAGVVGEAALIEALGKQILISLDLGNFDSISQSCIAQAGN